MSAMRELGLSGLVLPPDWSKGSFSERFRVDSVAPALVEGRSIASVARSLGCGESYQRWRVKRTTVAAHATPGLTDLARRREWPVGVGYAGGGSTGLPNQTTRLQVILGYLTYFYVASLYLGWERRAARAASKQTADYYGRRAIMEYAILGLLTFGFTAGLTIMIYLDRRNVARLDQSEQRTDKQFERVDQQFERFGQQMEQRFERIDQQFREFRAEVNAKFEAVDKKIEESARHIDGRVDRLDGRVDQLAESVNTRFDSVNTRFDAVNTRFDAVNRRIDKLADAVIGLAKGIGREEALGIGREEALAAAE